MHRAPRQKTRVLGKYQAVTRDRAHKPDSDPGSPSEKHSRDYRSNMNDIYRMLMDAVARPSHRELERHHRGDEQVTSLEYTAMPV